MSHLAGENELQILNKVNYLNSYMNKRVKVIISGVFTVPANGTWRMTYNLWSAYGGKDQNVLRLIYQGSEVVEMIYRSVAWTGAYKDRYVFSTGGREAFFHADCRTRRNFFNFGHLGCQNSLPTQECHTTTYLLLLLLL